MAYTGNTTGYGGYARSGRENYGASSDRSSSSGSQQYGGSTSSAVLSAFNTLIQMDNARRAHKRAMARADRQFRQIHFSIIKAHTAVLNQETAIRDQVRAKLFTIQRDVLKAEGGIRVEAAQKGISGTGTERGLQTLHRMQGDAQTAVQQEKYASFTNIDAAMQVQNTAAVMRTRGVDVPIKEVDFTNVASALASLGIGIYDDYQHYKGTQGTAPSTLQLKPQTRGTGYTSSGGRL